MVLIVPVLETQLLCVVWELAVAETVPVAVTVLLSDEVPVLRGVKVGALGEGSTVSLGQGEAVKARESERLNEGVRVAPEAVLLCEAVDDTVTVGLRLAEDEKEGLPEALPVLHAVTRGLVRLILGDNVGDGV